MKKAKAAKPKRKHAPKAKRAAPRNIEPAWSEPDPPKAPEPAPVIECCGTCHCWRDQHCKRYPPERVVITIATEWCGDWQTKR